MTLLLIAAWGYFALQLHSRWRLLRIGPDENRFDNVKERLRRTYEYAFVQKRMPRYKWAGYAHRIIFLGFIVLLLRSLILFARAYTGILPDRGENLFGYWLFDPGTVLGNLYALLKDIFALLVILAGGVFLYLRLIAKPKRLTLSFEGLLIILIIETMMLSDILYDGATGAYYAARGAHAGFAWYEPAGSTLSILLRGIGAGETTAMVLAHLGFWTHVSLVLIFLNLLPKSKHFHVITGIPNVYFQSLAPRGRLPNVADIEGKIEREETLGLARVNQLSWKAVLDLYTCTECGRCSDHCPATKTGKKLSPKHFTLDLRDFLYANEKSLVAAKPGPPADSDQTPRESVEAAPAASNSNGHPSLADIVPNIIDPEVIWACTSCGACETECPVFITYVDKIIDIRRHLVMEKSEFPAELQNAFRGMETNSNPWSFPASDRAGWTTGLDVPRIAEKPDADVLFWVGCSASFDDRARRIARAMAQLLTTAGVNFAILAEEENCTGDPARRAGNEFLFQMLAQMNVETLNRYNPKTIVTTCPHCFNTLLNEYPDFGAKLNVVHHSVYLDQLLKAGKLTPRRPINAKVAYHDSCYMGRYNEVYEPPRDALRRIPGLTVLEPAQTRDRGMCCGAGGAQMFKEEEPGTERVNIRRTEQLLETQPDVIASNCPFCQRMLIDGLGSKNRADIKQMDIAELLWESIAPNAAESAAVS
ncbi:MAG TPA: (Fe-S)-binding protein [Phycisphaerae bacterium]|nr:(Fe-S)-binding protein [Phycisphaerae bacterium]